jgi:hypothetical protein
MKQDQRGCSTCPSGAEQYERFYLTVKGKKQYYYQFEYRHVNGNLFVTTKPTLAECKAARDTWKSQQDQLEAAAEVSYFRSHPELNP